MATQSAELLDHFEPDEVVVVDRTDEGTKFERLPVDKLMAWLEDDYSLGELWNKNLFGGGITMKRLYILCEGQTEEDFIKYLMTHR